MEKIAFPKISIVTISYNQAEYLDMCIKSVESQLYPNFEHIIIDGGSIDGSLTLLRRQSEKKLGYGFSWVSEGDGGPADALNKGFRMATGDVFGFLNSDDVLLPHALQNVAFYFKKDFINMIQGSGLIIDGSNRLIRPVASIPFSLSAFLAVRHVIFQPSMFFRSDVYNSVGGFNYSNKTSWDAEFFIQCLLKGYEINFCPHVLSGFRLHSESKSGCGQDAETIKIDRQRMTKMCEQSRVIGKKFFFYARLRGWVLCFPYIFVASCKWIYKYGFNLGRRA